MAADDGKSWKSLQTDAWLLNSLRTIDGAITCRVLDGLCVLEWGDKCPQWRRWGKPSKRFDWRDEMAAILKDLKWKGCTTFECSTLATPEFYHQTGLALQKGTVAELLRPARYPGNINAASILILMSISIKWGQWSLSLLDRFSSTSNLEYRYLLKYTLSYSRKINKSQ